MKKLKKHNICGICGYKGTFGKGNAMVISEKEIANLPSVARSNAWQY
jgi:hypothetical protein